jgi:conjugal transfer pilus assembly protein TraD
MALNCSGIPNLDLANEIQNLQGYFYTNYFQDNSPKVMYGMDTVLECFKYIAGDETHYYKITASLMPMLKRLSQSPMDILLSANDVENPDRNIVNSHGLFNSGGVLYIRWMVCLIRQQLATFTADYL